MAEREAGIVTVLVLVVATVVLAATSAGLLWAGAVAARQRAEAAADLAALAAASAAAVGVDGCTRAARVVAASPGRVRLVSCTVAGTEATVLVAAPVPWSAGLDTPPARARARAGGS